MKNLRPRIRKVYRLKDQAAIDAINSKYSYEQVCYFFETLYLMLRSDRLGQLDQDQLRDNIKFIQIIMKLIDSPHLIYRIKKRYENRLNQLTPERLLAKSGSGEIMDLYDNFSAHLQWISSIVRKNNKISIEMLLGNYFNRFPYLPGQAALMAPER